MQGVNVHKRGVGAMSVLASFIGYGCFARYVERVDILTVFGLYALLFTAFYGLYKSGFSFRQLVVLSLLFRLLFIAAIPALSNDFYRFIWDGRMLAGGFNPYLYIPADFIVHQPGVIAEGDVLVAGMGALNAAHFTVYPPLNQLCFWLAGVLFPNSIAGALGVMRVLLIAADFGVLYFGAKILRHLNKNPRAIFLYVLSPFVVLEFTGNVHWEGLMVFFLVAGLYFLLVQRRTWAALLWGASFAVKLIPILFLPLLLPRWSFKKSILFGLISLGILIILFLPFLTPDLVQNFGSSLELYFQNFEFNASIYYLLREVGYWVYGYNNIALIGKVLPIIVLLAILLLTYKTRHKALEALPALMLLAVCIYYGFSTTVHPWYLGVPLVLSVFTPYRFMQVWTLLVIVSYYAYSTPAYSENMWLIALEYVLVLSFFVAERFNLMGLSDKLHASWNSKG
jgi:hypothetical protein